MRKLEDHFLEDLKTGLLNALLNYVKADNTLDLEIRENYINIYYRGGNLLRVKWIKSTYNYFFDEKYLTPSPLALKQSVASSKNNLDWSNYFPLAKQAMDFYFTQNPKLEREFQQVVVRENNYSTLSNGTDYFIVDIEYDNHADSRFDLVAIEWPSQASKRKLSKNFKPRLVVIEMKYGDNALAGEASLEKHYRDFNRFISNLNALKDFKEEMGIIFEQKRELGLIPCLSSTKNSNKILGFDDTVELAFLLANHDPESTKLNTQISSLANFPVKFLVANFMGYGIYNHSIHDITQFKEFYKTQLL